MLCIADNTRQPNMGKEEIMTINHGKTVIIADEPDYYNNNGIEFWLAFGKDDDGKSYEIFFDSLADVESCTPSEITRIYRGGSSSYSDRIDNGTIFD